MPFLIVAGFSHAQRPLPTQQAHDPAAAPGSDPACCVGKGRCHGAVQYFKRA
jgi:hypothetical protein